MKRNYVIFLLCFLYCSAFSQEGTKLKGIVIDAYTKQPVQGVSILLKSTGETTLSEYDGAFYFDGIEAGSDTLVISSPEINTLYKQVDIIAGQMNDAGTIVLPMNIKNQLNENAFVLIDEDAIGDDTDQSDYNVSSLMISSNDVYTSNTTYNFSAVRFKARGYDYKYSDTYINGVNFSDPERGGFSFGMLGGLNDVTRSNDIVNGMTPSSYTYGQVGGSGNINTNATNYSRGGKAGVAYTNRNYKFRGTAVYSTGLMNNGWAVTGSLAYRWADEGNIEGTFYNSLGAFLAIEKIINPKNALSLTLFAVPTQRAQQSAAPEELQSLLGHYYNSNWGWQECKKRSSRIITSFEPVAILSHTWTIDKNTKLKTGLGFRYTNYGSTALNRGNATSDPRPDYYQNLPSYAASLAADDDRQKYVLALYQNKWRSDPTVSQINWQRMYDANRNNPDDGSLYIVEERHDDQMNITLNSTLNTRLTDKISFTAGIEARTTKGMHYKTVSDLLGGDYFLNVNAFAQRDFSIGSDQTQYDLNNPNQEVGKGGRFGYDYNIYSNSAGVWFQNTHRYKKWDIFYGTKFAYTDFYRYGNMRNGLAPDNSYGKGSTHSFINQSSKLGVMYKLSGRHLFSANISYTTLPPLIYDAYLSPRVKDNAIPNMKSEANFSAEASYLINTPFIKGRLTAFQTNFYDQARMYNMYSDADGTFVNYALTGINKTHRGIELGAQVRINSNLSVSAAGTVAEYFYNNRPTGTTSYENGTADDKPEVVYLKNIYVGGTPQTAGTIGADYFYKYWFFNLNLNGFDRTYIDVSPIKRTETAVQNIINVSDADLDSYEDVEAKVKQATSQEKFKGGCTLDFSIGRSLRFQQKYTLNINLQFKNILNNTDLKTGGYEYNRIDLSNANSNKFPSYYYYAQGFNCYLNVGLRF